MNCIRGRREESWLPCHPINLEILEENEAWLESSGIKVLPLGGRLIFSCNALFYWSQQEEFEKSKAYIDRPDTVQKHITGLLREEEIDDSMESILEQSKIPDLIQNLKDRIGAYDPVTHAWG